MTLLKFQKIILGWYKENRRDLPWRKTRDPYKILVSEIMLQQTQISRVLPKYKEFLKVFPTLETVAKASDKKLLKIWAGLGYWRRALYLKETAKIILEKKRTMDFLRTRRAPSAAWGKAQRKSIVRVFPKKPKILETLPGIGPYTARALACFAFGSKEAFLDTNIRRVYLHFFFPKSKNVPDKKILKVAQKATSNLCICINSKYSCASTREWHYALFDYGATVLKDKSINKRSRHYHKQSRFEGSFRSFRTKAIKFILAHPQNKISRRALTTLLQKELKRNNSLYTPKQIIAALLEDRLIKTSRSHYSL